MPNPRAKSVRAARIGRVDVEKRVERLARLVEEIEVALRRAEREIEADAGKRIQTLHKEANEQLALLHDHQRAASHLLWQLSTAPVESWGDLGQAADRALSEAHTVAASMLERFRRGVPRSS